MRTIAYCEIELYAIENLVSKMEKGLLEPTPIWSNLKTFPFSDFRGTVDFISGGFPCQPFSTAGRQRGDTDPRHLFPFIKRGIEQCRPAFVFLENVRGIVNAKLQSDEWSDPKGTSVLLHVCRELERIGYIVEWGLFTARETGLPHLRHRVFILGTRRDIKDTQLKEFSKYIQNNTEIMLETHSYKKADMEQRISSDDSSRNISSDPTIILQRFTRSTSSVETIESKFIANPSGRNRDQQFYEPPRTLDRGTNRRDELAYSDKNGIGEYQFSTSSEKTSDEREGNAPPSSEANERELSSSYRGKQERGNELEYSNERGYKTSSSSIEGMYREENQESITNGDNITSVSRSLSSREQELEYSNEGGYKRYNGSNTNESDEEWTRTREQNNATSSSSNMESNTQYPRENIYRIEGNRQREPQTEHSSNQSQMGGNANGLADWLDYARLCNSFSSIIDEIALLGNGVVPATAEIAFKTLFNKILSSLN
jgi:site-specific DNA-cytosine methylase